MGRVYDAIDDRLAEFLRSQRVFFVGTAPTAPDGHLNISPKGLDTFRILGPTTVAYLDLTGSGNETSAHLRENGRITLMFCAFDGPPRILRLYGRGAVALPGSPAWDELRPGFGDHPGARQLIVAVIDRVQTSCGFAVPLYDYAGQRDVLTKWATVKGEAGLAEYRRERNARSIDGLVTPLGEGG